MTAQEISLRTLISDLTAEDRGNVAVILGLDKRATEQNICETVRWLYHSKFRRAGRIAIGSGVESGKRHILRAPADDSWADAIDEDYPVPTWNELVEGMASYLSVYDKQKNLETNEKYICQDIIARALGKMTPEQRSKYFEETIQFSDVVGRGAPSDSNMKGVGRGVMALTLAQAAGFSLYTSSATALSFLTGSFGITLPFAAYTGLSSLISFVTGPFGWTAVAIFAVWKLTSANWKKLSTAIVYIINVHAQKAKLGDR